MTRTKTHLQLVSGLIIVVAVSLLRINCTPKEEQLNQARSYLKIREVNRAADLYREYLVANPNDLQARLEYVGVLGSQSEYQKQREILDELEKENPEGDMRWRTKLDSVEATYYLTMAELERNLGREYMIAHDYAKAKNSFVIAYLDASQHEWYSMRVIPQTLPWAKVYFRSYNLDIAYSSWFLGERAGSSALFEDTVGIFQYADKINELASTLFDEKKFGEAADAFREAWSYYTRYGKPKADEVVAEIKYNMGMSMMNQRYYREAMQILMELREEAPNYEHEKLNRMIRDLNALSQQ